MNTATPAPMSAARPATSVSNSNRSISMSPESARPTLGGPSIAGVQRSMSLPPRLVRSPNAFSVAKTSLTRPGARCRTDNSRTAACNAPVRGRRRLVSGRASTFPVPHPRSSSAGR